MHQIQIDYLKQFWNAYPNNRKFFRTHFSEAHELSGELVQYTDRDIRDLLQYFHDQGYLEDTFVTLLSDHGAHALTLRFPAFPDNSRYIENYYPMLFHVTKNDLPSHVSHHLEANEQSFIGSHDFYSTMKSIAENKRSTSKNAESYPYFMEGMPLNHDCSDSSVYTAD
jgi:arylsulfatase A-like enzyme